MASHVPSAQIAPDSKRLVGLDFARFLAFFGMVLVNFHVVTGPGSGADWAVAILNVLEGKAAATFVVLAGIGFSLGDSRSARQDFVVLSLKRSLFLFVIGLINSLVFPADILHYYAVYFVFGLLLVRAKNQTIFAVMAVLPFVFVLLLFVLDYDIGWNWETLDYQGFWTATGFVRNLFFNGWHPVVPWLSFLLLGVLLARLNLAIQRTQMMLVAIGALLLVVGYALSGLWTRWLEGELAVFGSTSPVPPLPLYMVVGSGAAMVVIGISLLLCGRGASALGIFAITGRHALTLYIAHILLGMGALEFLGMIGGQSAEVSIYASVIFVMFAVAYAVIWSRFAKRGPVEWLMRRLAG